jgi:hypothetical protein
MTRRLSRVSVKNSLPYENSSPVKSPPTTLLTKLLDPKEASSKCRPVKLEASRTAPPSLELEELSLLPHSPHLRTANEEHGDTVMESPTPPSVRSLKTIDGREDLVPSLSLSRKKRLVDDSELDLEASLTFPMSTTTLPKRSCDYSRRRNLSTKTFCSASFDTSRFLHRISQVHLRPRRCSSLHTLSRSSRTRCGSME